MSEAVCPKMCEPSTQSIARLWLKQCRCLESTCSAIQNEQRKDRQQCGPICVCVCVSVCPVCVYTCVPTRVPRGLVTPHAENTSRDQAFSVCFLPLGQGVGRLSWWGALWVTLRRASQWPHGALWSRSLLLLRDKGLQALHLPTCRKVRTKFPTLVTWFRLTVTFRGSDSLPFVTDPKLAPALARSQQLSQGFLGRPLWT